jgi:hypothetical protein
MRPRTRAAGVHPIIPIRGERMLLDLM